MKTKNSLKRKTANFFGEVGYFFISIQWLWAVVLYSNLITALAKIMSQGTDKNVVKPTAPFDLSQNLPMTIITVVITLVMVVLTIYILIKIPSILIKTSKKVAHSAAENATPLVLKFQNKKDTKKNHIKLTPSLIIVMKILLTFIPVILAYFSQFTEKQILNFYVAIYVSVLLACFSLLFFVFQYLAASLLSIKKEDVF
jgi:hypothetical protein